LVELERNLSGIRKQGLGLAAISYDSVAILKNFAVRRKITFPLIADPDSRIIRAFGILNETVKADTPAYGVPRPGTYIVDRQGKIVSKYFEEDYRERVSITDILAGRFGERVAASGGAVQAKHVRLSTAASTLVAHPGHRILLTLELDLKPRMHVYAPGVAGYIPIEWKLEESGAARVGPVQYPAARKLHLKPIQETALVYQGRVRLTREITFGAENTLKPLVSPAGDVVLKGSLRYQACDDRECYLPETAPVVWKFRFEALDRERVPAQLQRKAR
jgi:hypothetical protein